jgi:hypothetical protein
MSSLKLTRQITSLSTFNTSTNRSMTYWTKPMLSTSNDMINIGCHTSSRWATKFGYICRRSASLGPTASFTTLIWAIHHHQGCMGDNSFELNIPPFLGLAPSVQCGSPSTILSTITGHIRHCRTTHTNRVKSRLHGTSHN